MDTAILDQYVQLLRSPDTERRRQAIVALGRSKNPAALRPLAEAYRNEQDEELRQLALRAGQFIKSQTSTSSAAAPAAPVPQPEPAPAEDLIVVAPFIPGTEDAAAPLEPLTKPVQNHRLTKPGHDAAKSAKAYAEEALTLSLRGDTAKAIKAIKKAYQLYPALIEDTYYAGLATTVLHCDEDELLDYLKDTSRANAVIKTAAQEKTNQAVQTHLEEAQKMSWLGVELDLIIFSLIMAVAPVVLLLVVGESLAAWSALLVEEGGEMDERLVDILLLTEALNARALVAMAGTFLVSGLLSLVVQCLAIHYSATRFLGGTGTLRYLMYKLISYYNRLLVTVFAVLMVTTWLFVSNGLAVVMIPVFIGLGLYGLLKFIKLGDRIGEAYKFTSGGGCMSVLVAGLVLVVSNGLIAYIVYLVLTNVIMTLLPALSA